MNKRRVLNVLGRIVLTEALLMIPSLAVSLYYGDGDAGYRAAGKMVAARDRKSTRLNSSHRP